MNPSTRRFEPITGNDEWSRPAIPRWEAAQDSSTYDAMHHHRSFAVMRQRLGVAPEWQAQPSANCRKSRAQNERKEPPCAVDSASTTAALAEVEHRSNEETADAGGKSSTIAQVGNKPCDQLPAPRPTFPARPLHDGTCQSEEYVVFASAEQPGQRLPTACRARARSCPGRFRCALSNPMASQSEVPASSRSRRPYGNAAPSGTWAFHRHRDDDAAFPGWLKSVTGDHRRCSRPSPIATER